MVREGKDGVDRPAQSRHDRAMRYLTRNVGVQPVLCQVVSAVRPKSPKVRRGQMDLGLGSRRIQNGRCVTMPDKDRT
jgi:hypothetical protein